MDVRIFENPSLHRLAFDAAGCKRQGCDYASNRRALKGNFGDVASLAGGLSEMRIHTGPGYRVYFAKRDSTVYLLLAGGTKSGQQRDIDTARVLWRQIQTRENYDEN
ncbi:hypothetical protein RBI14_05260 [Alcaligenaceae bacterium B3P038]|nr:hypothetical protein [Alcaligenaceae bacterium B3P038]